MYVEKIDDHLLRWVQIDEWIPKNAEFKEKIANWTISVDGTSVREG
jgi:hypothetical protein